MTLELIATTVADAAAAGVGFIRLLWPLDIVMFIVWTTFPLVKRKLTMNALKYSLMLLLATASAAHADVIDLGTHNVVNIPYNFAVNSDVSLDSSLAVAAFIPGQPSGTSFSGPLGEGGTVTVDFRDTNLGQVADVRIDLLGTPQRVAGFTVFGPFSGAEEWQVPRDESVQGTFTVHAPYNALLEADTARSNTLRDHKPGASTPAHRITPGPEAVD